MVAHDVILRGLSSNRVVPGPLIIKRSEEDFIGAVLDGLAAEGGAATIAASEVTNAKGALSLFQPVHRIFHLALLEVVCDTPGLPRLDPSKIEGAGLVVRRKQSSPNLTLRIANEERLLPNRRLRRISNNTGNELRSGSQALQGQSHQGWMQAGKKMRGWVPFLNETHEDLDPDPKYRRRPLTAGNEEIDRRLLQLSPLSEALTLSESVSPLFVAPPEVCTAAKRTILYGLVPVTSSERGTGPPDISPLDENNFSDADLNEHLPYFLRGNGERVEPSASSERRVSQADVAKVSLKGFIDSLRQLHFEFDAFGESNESSIFFSEINQLSITFDSTDDSPRKLGDYLKLATRMLALEEDKTRSITIPKEWPHIDTTRASRIRNAARSLMKSRLAFIGGPGNRFENPEQQYSVRAFVRFRHDDNCPPTTRWSEYSDSFTIIPWYAPSEAPPARIELPNPFDRNFLNQLRPDVAFKVPKDLFNLINGNPKKLRDGEREDGSSFAFDWICGFNIPLITICAFIVLYIFLTLFNLIFQWLFAIKVCIPFPRKT